MNYPAAPWKLQGEALQTLNLVEVEKARNFVPKELKIISVLPGLTLGVVYLSNYQSGSILEYSELIVVPALVRYQSKIGGWISHIYVDNEKSVAGGREIWGLPKEMADFSWGNNQVTVTQNHQQLCQLTYQKGIFNFSSWWRQKLAGDFFSELDSKLLCSQGNFKFKIELVKGSLTIPSASPFSGLNFSQPLITLNLPQLELVANSPTVISNI